MTTEARLCTALRRLESLDLSLIRLKLADPLHGLGWSEDILIRAEAEYKQFLALTYAYPDEAIVPSALADEFWHAHILDTRSYAADCDAVFGFFVHHFPYLGIRGAEDVALLSSLGERTQKLLERHFMNGAAIDMTALSSCGSCSSAPSVLKL